MPFQLNLGDRLSVISDNGMSGKLFYFQHKHRYMLAKIKRYIEK